MKDEIAIMSRFNHAHVIKHIESYEDNNYVFMVMEALTDSCELQTILRGNKAKYDPKLEQPLFQEDMVRWMAKSICSGLAHIHANGIVHRDLKPQNILIDAEKRCVKIIDFGLAKIANVAHKAGLLIGTLDYIAPEIISSKGDPKAYAAPCDMWALGIMMYLLFSGKALMKQKEQKDTM